MPFRRRRISERARLIRFEFIELVSYPLKSDMGASLDEFSPLAP
jgi:hypothetical protein